MSVSLSQTTSRFKVFDLIDNHSKASSGNRLGNPAANNSKLEKQMDTVESRIDNIEKK